MPQLMQYNTIEVPISEIGITPFKDMDTAIASVFDPNGKVLPGFALAMNAEKVMSARSSPSVRDVLNLATIRYPDGIGVVWALRRKGFTAAKIPGCELWEQVMVKASQCGSRVFLVGATPDVLNKVIRKLQVDLKVNVIGYQDGYFPPSSEDELIHRICNLKPDIVTVAMGSPHQEKFIAKCREQYPNAFYMGAGGTYDVYIGKVKRAPKWALRLHIEWLYRLFQSPKRIKRQIVLIPFFFLLSMNRL